MKKIHVLFILPISFIAILTGCNSKKSLDLPLIFSDHMVLQRGIEIPIWGTATPGTTVTVQLAGNKVRTKAEENGKWMVKVPALTAGGPYNLVIDNGKTITFDDVLIGDVWFASGQSNMEFSVKSARNSAAEIIDALNFPLVRLFNVPKSQGNKPKENLPGGQWQVCDSSSVKDFSAVAYFFWP
jgi:sialate O-acetylesterase